MSYRDRITAQLEGVYLKGIANKILQFMQKIRNEYDEGQARRWAMELLQNGRDVAYPEGMVKVRFDLSEDKLVYQHTGQPFRVKDILSIIYQVSSKNPGQGSVGRFGTGFMSTYQLCERVQLDGILKDSGEAYCPFQVMLDRTGENVEAILEKIEASVEQVKQAETVLAEEEFQKEAYNTKFTYFLETSRNKQAARIGMEDMKENISYIMLFSDKVQEITLAWHTPEGSREVVYRRGEDVCVSEQQGVRRLRLIISDSELGGLSVKNDLDSDDNAGEKEYFLLYYTEDGVTVAAGMDTPEHFVPISVKTPRLFIDFPLIGAEEFPFPVVVNSRRLEPNEPRSGIALSDNPNSKDSVTNRDVMTDAVHLYRKLLAYAVGENYAGLQYIMSIPKWRENREHSESWVRSNLYRKIYTFIAGQAFLRTNNGMHRISDIGVYLVRGVGSEEGNGVRELLLAMKNYYVPVDEVDWPQVLSGFEICVPQTKIIGLPELIQRAEEMLRLYVDEQKMSRLSWCQQLYDLAMKNEEQALYIRSGQVKIYPNQVEADIKVGKLFTSQEVKLDAGIPEVIKDVSEALDGLHSNVNDPLYIRKNLVHIEFKTQGEVPSYETSRLFEYIRCRSDHSFTVQNFRLFGRSYEEAWKKAWELLLSCGYDKELYTLYEQMKKQMGEGVLRPYEKEENLPTELFRNAYWNICERMLQKLADCATLRGIQSTYFPSNDIDKVYSWLNEFYAKAMQYLNESKMMSYKAFPNQEGKLIGHYTTETGTMTVYPYLKIDESKAEELKSVLAVFADTDPENNFYRKLLDKKIVLLGTALSVITDETIGTKLNNVLQQMLLGHNISDVKAEYQDACTRVLAFIQENPEEARKYFPSFCSPEDQMRLLAPGAAVRMSQQAKQLEQLLKQAGVDTMEEMVEMLAQVKNGIGAGRNKCSDSDLPEGYYFGDGWDVFWDDEWDGSQDEFEQEMRRIGTAGEKYAFQHVCEQFSEWKEEERTESKAVFYNPEEKMRVTVEYPDTDTYKQSGWDIRIQLTDENGDVQDCHYIEVKTHTTKSVVKRRLFISKQQMQMAAKHGEHFFVLMVSYDKDKKCCVGIKAYCDLLQLFANGAIRSVTEIFDFEV